jgi:hypothetical protein
LDLSDEGEALHASRRVLTNHGRNVDKGSLSIEPALEFQDFSHDVIPHRRETVGPPAGFGEQILGVPQPAGVTLTRDGGIQIDPSSSITLRQPVSGNRFVKTSHLEEFVQMPSLWEGAAPIDNPVKLLCSFHSLIH